MEQELLDNDQLWNLFETITSLKTPEETARFFRDLCTLNELAAMAERWEVAQMVNENHPYREISRRTGASTATITRIAHWVRHGEGGYRRMLQKQEEGSPSQEEASSSD